MFLCYDYTVPFYQIPHMTFIAIKISAYQPLWKRHKRQTSNLNQMKTNLFSGLKVAMQEECFIFGDKEKDYTTNIC